MANSSGKVDPRDRFRAPEESTRRVAETQQAGMWTALPLIIKKLDAKQNTVNAQPSIKLKHVKADLSTSWVDMPTLGDMPIYFPGGGGVSMTFPVKPGNEGLAVFSSRSIDKWWHQGGAQEQLHARMHDISDGFVFPGFRSRPNWLDHVNEDSFQLRTDDGKTHFTMDPRNGGAISMVSTANPTTMTGKAWNIDVESSNLKAQGSIKLDTPVTNVTKDMIVDGRVDAKGGFFKNGLPIGGGGSGGGGGAMNSVTAGTGLIATGTTTDTIISLIIPVAIAFGGTGATTAAAGLANLGGAPINNPVFTGDPRITTQPPAGDADTSIANTGWVNQYFLKLTGGTLSGGLTVNSTLNVTGATTLAGLAAGASTLNSLTVTTTSSLASATALTPPAADSSNRVATTAWIRGYVSPTITVTTDDVAPASPTDGTLWWDSITGQLYIYYTDPNSSAWIQANSGAGFGTSGGPYLPLIGGSLSGPILWTGPATYRMGLEAITNSKWFAIGTTDNARGLWLRYTDVAAESALVTSGSIYIQNAVYPDPTAGHLFLPLNLVLTNTTGDYGIMWNAYYGANWTRIATGTTALFRWAGANGQGYEFYYAPSAAPSVAPVWTKIAGINTWGLYILSTTDPGSSNAEARFSSTKLRFRQNVGDEVNAGTIDYRGFDASALNIVGAGTTGTNRTVHIFDNCIVGGTLSTSGALSVSGALSSGHHTITGGINATTEIKTIASLACSTYLWINGLQWSNNANYMYTGSFLWVGGDIRVDGGIAIYGGSFYNAFGNGWLYFSGSLQVYDFRSSNNVYCANVSASTEVYATRSLACGSYIWCNSLQLSNNGGWWYSGSGFRCGDFQTDGNVNLLNRGTIWCGTVSATGDVNADGVVRFGGMYWQNSEGWAWCPWQVRSGGNILANNDVYAQNIFRRNARKGAAVECPGWDYDWLSPFASGGVLYMTPDYSGGPYFVNDGWWSDSRLKKNIRDTEVDALAAIVATRMVAFEWTQEGIDLQISVGSKETRSDLGLIGQELQQNIPLAVQPCAWEHATLFINWNQVQPYYFRAIQQLAEKNRTLEERIEALEAKLEQLLH